jgi:hypothetical protein
LTQPLWATSFSVQMLSRWRDGVRGFGVAALVLCAPAAHGAEEPPTAAAETQTTTAGEPGLPRTVVRIFGDIDWRTQRESVPSTFVLGQIDVFLTSELATNVSVLAETVLESPEDTRAQIAEVERFQLQYSPADALTVSVGRMHTMLGFWNQTYHHGTWLQTTAFRPVVYRWEDEDGGLLPVHEVGLRVSGAATASPLRFEYAASVANGRSASPSRVATLQDENSAKALHLWAGLSPRALPHLQFGGAAVLDTIPPDPERGRPEPLDERIWGGFLAFQGRRLELLAEAFFITHRDERAPLEWKSSGYYAQAAWSAGRFKPYYRFDFVDRAEGDPYYGPELQDVRMHTAGLRVDPWSRVAFKVEASRSRVAGRSPYTAAAVQAAFTF